MTAPTIVRIPTWVPFARRPRRGAAPRLARMQVALDARLTAIPPDAAEPLFVHEGQGRSHGVPVLAVGADLYTALPHAGLPPAEALANLSTKAVLRDTRAFAALAGSPVVPRNVASERTLPVEIGLGLDGADLAAGGEAAAAEALARYLDRNVRLCGDRVLVRIPGPLAHLSHDRNRLVATLNPALVGLDDAALPVFAPLADRESFHRRMARAGATSRRAQDVLHVDHLDANGRQPLDLMALPAPPDAARDAALATALLAPSFVAAVTRRFLDMAGPALVEPVEPALARLAAAAPYARFGHLGVADPHDALRDAVAVLDHVVNERPGLVSWKADNYRHEVREHVLPVLAQPPEPRDEADLALLAP